ncbi:MAG: nucleotide exchange factor GrpE [Phycisphaerae bacterium]|nr:nucleotide exchange factor GrpE [Phycisphaerae bacterium]
MSRTNWIILALALMVPGTIGLGWGHLQKRASERRIAEARRAVADAPSADEYLQMYHEWSQLPAAEKAENQWGYGKYGGPDIQKRLRQDQGLRLEADLPDLDAGVRSYPPQLAEVLYGIGWPDRVADYQRQRETRGLVITASVILLFAGGLWLLGGGVKHYLSRYFSDEGDEVEQESQNEQIQPERPRRKPQQQVKKPASESDADDIAEDADDLFDESSDTDKQPAHSPGYFESVMGPQKRPDYRKPAPITAVSGGGAAKSVVSMLDVSATAEEKSYFGWAMDPEQEDVPVATLMTTQAAANGLTELTEEVSAIRQFAAAQQDQMRKLQDGYDWMIIRRFCMRIIRCIDNLDDRMARLDAQEGVLQSCLMDIRDELIFALESSGIEQFQPDLKTPFKGLEKYAEAVRQRVPVTDADLAGTIAEIVRPGYQYLISDDDVKIVRCAQVKVYDTVQTEA